MLSHSPTGSLRARAIPVLATIVSLACFACSGSSGAYSGRYEADMGGGTAALDFSGSNKVTVTLTSPDGKDKLQHHCVYTVADGKMHITTDEPMGAPMDLMVTSAGLDAGGMLYKKK
jgi:hypothetical protein